MKEIFTELYKKVAGFFQSPEKENVKEVACNRLKFVLMQDRTNLTPQLLERMKGELIDLLSKYVEMDRDALELNFEQEGDSMALMLSIPVVRAKDEEEIQELIRLEEEAKAKAEAEAAELESEEAIDAEEEISESEETTEEESCQCEECDDCKSCALENEEESKDEEPTEEIVEDEIEEKSSKKKK